jgi:D-psicose/D-tagatose/L-ribulose 3-epimerase
MKLDRRSLLLGALPLFAAKAADRLAICSETFAGMNFPQACKAARRSAYSGIEIDPAHLSSDPAALTAGERREFRRILEDEDLRYVGVHSFLKVPTGLHLTTPDAAIRSRSWDYFARLVDLAADLGDRPVMVLGSSKQRAVVQGSSVEAATGHLIEGLAGMAPLAAQRAVTILVEPLAPHLCNLVNTLEEALRIVRTVNSPAVQTMLDTHNTAAEKLTVDLLVRKYLPFIRHVHLNEMDGRRPGAGNFPFGLLLETLQSAGYSGWLSVEVFDFQPDGETVARLAAEFLKKLGPHA